MAKGKKSSGKHYTSKGVVGVDKKILKAIKRERSEFDNLLNAIHAWEKGHGLKAPKLVRKAFGVTENTTYRDWQKRQFVMKQTANVG